MGHRTSLGPRRPGRIDLFGTFMRLSWKRTTFWEKEEYFSFIVRFFSIEDTDIEKNGVTISMNFNQF